MLQNLAIFQFCWNAIDKVSVIFFSKNEIKYTENDNFSTHFRLTVQKLVPTYI